MGPVTKTIALLTGANQGIGRAAALRLAQDHDIHVVIGSRSLENGQKVVEELKLKGFDADAVQLDIQSDASISAATSYIDKKYGRLDVLINNAGILLDGRAGEGVSMREMYQTTFSTNAIGTACVTESLLPLLRKSSQRPRVIFVSSIMGSLATSLDSSTYWYDKDYRAYDASKAAVNMLAINYSRILADKHAYVNVVCPGLVATNLTGYMAAGSEPDVGARRIVEMATLTGTKSDVTGTFSNSTGVLAW